MAEVFKFNWENNEYVFDTCICAQNIDQARLFLKKRIKSKFRINTASQICKLDSITKEATKEVFIEEEDAAIKKLKNFKCPWCDEYFKSEQGLKIHIGKAHK